jgi:hypothetical protein
MVVSLLFLLAFSSFVELFLLFVCVTNKDDHSNKSKFQKKIKFRHQTDYNQENTQSLAQTNI